MSLFEDQNPWRERPGFKISPLRVVALSGPRAPRTYLFIEFHHPEHALVLNRTLIAETSMGSTRIHFLPLALFAWINRRLLQELLPG